MAKATNKKTDKQRMAHGAQKTRGIRSASSVRGARGAKGKGATLKSPAQARLDRRANDEKIIKTIRLVFAAVVVLAVVGVAAGVFIFVYKPPVASVGGMPIRQYEMNYFINALSQNSDNSEYYDYDPGQIREDALQQATDLKIHNAKAKEMGITLTAEDNETMDSMMNVMIPYYAEMTGVDEKQYARDYFGISLSEYKSLLNTMLLNDRLASVLMEDVGVTDEDALQVFEAQPEHYNEATVRHVLFLFEGTDEENPRTREESLALAEDTLQRVNDGEDIGDLAMDLSEDTGSASSGGEYTIRQDDPYVQEFLDWSFSSEVGDTGIVETEYGYHVMELDARRSTFEDFKDDITEELKQQAVTEQFEAWRGEPQYEVTINQDVYDSLI